MRWFSSRRGLWVAPIVATLGAALSVAAQPGATAVAAPAAGAAVVRAASALPRWQTVHLGGAAVLWSISPVNRRVVWAGGSNGTVLRTTNGGRSWRDVGPPGTQALEFRGIKGFDADHAVIMSIGTHPNEFRIYLTSDGGAHWVLTNRNSNPQAFYDCMAFFNRSRGLVLSDPVNGKFRILITADGGRTWRIDPPANMPPANSPNEFGFSAGSCLTTHGTRDAWFGSGGRDGARVFRSTDGGVTWTVAATPVRRGPTAGIYSIAFRTTLQGVVVGGSFRTPTFAPRAVALTADGGRTWTLVGNRAAPGQYRSGVTWVPGTSGTAVAVGLTGSDVSLNGGFRWTPFSRLSFNVVQCAPDGSCWAAGVHARIGRLTLP